MRPGDGGGTGGHDQSAVRATGNRRPERDLVQRKEVGRRVFVLSADRIGFVTERRVERDVYYCFSIFRVALVPSSVELLKKHGWNIRVEHGAGTGAKFRNRDYEIAGAEIVSKENAFASGL